jgi:hypothetical protein
MGSLLVADATRRVYPASGPVTSSNLSCGLRQGHSRRMRCPVVAADNLSVAASILTYGLSTAMTRPLRCSSVGTAIRRHRDAVPGLVPRILCASTQPLRRHGRSKRPVFVVSRTR